MESDEPLIHLDLLKNKVLMGIISLRTCAQYVFFVFMFFICLYLQNLLGFTAEKAGYLLLASTVVLGILSPFAGHLMNYFSARFLIALSCFILAISLSFLIWSSLTSSFILLLIALVLFGIGFAIHFPTTNLAALQTAPTNQAALVTGMLFTLAFAGASAGITLSSTLLNDSSKYKLTELVNDSHINLTTAQQALLQQVSSGTKSLMSLNSLPNAISTQAISMSMRSFIYGFVFILSVCVFLSLIAMIIAIVALKNFNTRQRVKADFLLEM
jgi:hypothetical protein